jgi:hypothetical protein
MCSSPKMPPPPPAPVKPQEARAPDVSGIYRSKKKDQTPIVGGTLLTGPTGIDNAALNTGKTLLGT